MPRDGRFRFDNFVVGAANRLAAAAAHAVAESPGAVYNPLFIYSGSGLGKTHLMGAIATHAVQVHGKLNVEYATLEDLVEELRGALAANQIEKLRERYRFVDLLLLDDVQFLTGHRETQTEILRLLNAMQGNGRQIVMASDRPPNEIADVDERLLTRLSGGLIVDIGAPDYETRVAILRAKCAEREVRLADGVVEELARYEFSNIRELQGSLNRLVAHQALGDGLVEPSQVAAVLGLRPEQAVVPPSPPASELAVTRGQEFESFLDEVASAVAQHVESWRVRVGEQVARWSSEGYRASILEELIRQPEPPPNWEAVLRGFGAVIERLRTLEESAAAIDPSLRGAEVFRDPERVPDAERLLERLHGAATPPSGPSAAFERTGFEVGQSNELAVRAADAVIAEPGRRYNPLFIHGSSGVGKTHLAHAIGNALVDSSGGAMRVACVSAQAFMDELIDALKESSVNRWRARYRAVDALIVDDVQFAAGKERTQEELFHVFNALHDEGKQLVFVSDRPPKALEGLEERLRSRFEGGLVVELHAPDQALRERLYARFLTQTGQTPTADLLAFLARRPVASVREIQGTISRMVARAEAAGTGVTTALARIELDGVRVPRLTPRFSVAAGFTGEDGFFLDDEKVVWEWPDLGARLIEEVR
ncbi:MAG: DnaA ATPase domain-containing protein [Gemmatimonadaceae bacterium]